jgi:glutathione synthase/RimK-type ligase-like ATP-grasp enzyme
MKRCVLIVTSIIDEHADLIAKELLKREILVLRLNTETFINESIYSFEWSSGSKAIAQELMLSQVVSSSVQLIWWRLPGEYYTSESLVDENARKYSILESKEIVENLESIFPNAKWINSYQGIQKSLRRIHQIKAAQEVGLDFPPTLVTNDFESAKSFLSEYDKCIIKTMSCRSFIKDGTEYTSYTKGIDIETLTSLKDSVRLAPIFLQKRVEKQAEYRITIIGEKTFTCRIDADHLDSADSKLDWRVANPSELIHTPDIIPNELNLKLRKMMRMFDLSFAAIDVIYSTDGNYYFLDLNPTGQWIWIELATGMPMIEEFIDLISSYISD